MSTTEKPIKVLAIADYLGRKNLNPVRPEAAQILGMQKTGLVDISIMCSPESILVDFYRGHGLDVITHKIRKKVSLETIRFIRKLVREQGFQIIHLYHSRALSNGTLAAIGLPVKVVAYRGQPGSLRRYDPISYLNALSPRIDKIICVSKATEVYIREQLWTDSDKPVTVYKGHDLSWYQDPPADLADLNLPENAFTVCMIANLRAHKGLHVLLGATHFLPPDAPIHILLVGPKADDPEILAQVAKTANPERIHIMGYRNDAPEVAAASNVIVLPTLKREGLARAVLEAMAYGCPAIVSSTGGNPEQVADGESGYVVPPDDPQALAEAIVKLWKDPEKCERFGVEARRRIETIFNVENGIEKTLKVYQELVKQDC
jgi:glycosyltransferase involved in cell wall biosynthesis